MHMANYFDKKYAFIYTDNTKKTAKMFSKKIVGRNSRGDKRPFRFAYK